KKYTCATSRPSTHTHACTARCATTSVSTRQGTDPSARAPTQWNERLRMRERSTTRAVCGAKISVSDRSIKYKTSTDSTHHIA
ncbi:Hypothetical predicted protein, partial [Pelobates cultripes]